MAAKASVVFCIHGGDRMLFTSDDHDDDIWRGLVDKTSAINETPALFDGTGTITSLMSGCSYASLEALPRSRRFSRLGHCGSATVGWIKTGGGDMGLFRKKTDAVRGSAGPGVRGLTISSTELSETYYWVYETWKGPEPDASRKIMAFRYDLGLEIACWDLLPQNQRFWFDAYPALGARVLKEYGDRFDAGFVGELERRAMACVDSDNESQLKALRTMRDQPV